MRSYRERRGALGMNVFPPSEEIDTERVTEAPNHPPYPPQMRLALPCPNLVYLWGYVRHRTQLNALYGIS